MRQALAGESIGSSGLPGCGAPLGGDEGRTCGFKGEKAGIVIVLLSRQ